MIELRPFATLGAANHGWLDAHHHFSFASYYEPERTQWGALQVWNDDAIAPKTGFPPHPHQDMEIVTYVRAGAITHKDSLGNMGRTGAGDVQVMSAGTGIQHAEYNLEDEETRLFQIWILPDERGHAPSWGARPFPRDDRSGKFVVLASGMAPIPTRCASTPRRGSPGRWSGRASPSAMKRARIATSTWFPPRAASASAKSKPMPATAWQSPVRP